VRSSTLPAADSPRADTGQRHGLLLELSVLVHSRLTALIARDRQLLERLLDPAFQYTNASGKVFDRDAYIRTYALDTGVVWSAQTLSDVSLTQCDAIAVLTAVTHDVAQFGDYRLDASFRTTQVYRRSAGTWQYLAGHTSSPD
jgi:hypothetical protein